MIRIQRREFVAALGSAAAAWPLAVRGQQRERMRRIGVLWNLAADDPESSARLTPFVQALQRSGWTDGLARSLHYGIALQRPLGLDPFGTGSSVHLFVEALGRSRFFAYGTESPSSSWEVLPGLHWRVGDNCWMSGGVIVPLNNQHFDPGLVQITCWWKF